MKLETYVLELSPVLMETSERKNVLGVQVTFQSVLTLEDFNKLGGNIDGKDGAWQLQLSSENKKK